MTVLNAKNLSLDDVRRFFGFQKQYADSFTPLLSLEPLTELEQQELSQIRDDFEDYFFSSKVAEGLVKALTTFPLMRLAGFYRHPIKISLEEETERIVIEEEESVITGRFDILSIHKERLTQTEIPLWVLAIEAKNSQIDSLAGLPQLLTYAYKSLERQESVWGLTTNGRSYQFISLQRGDIPIYQLFPELNLFEPDRSVQILQVLKAICQG